MSETDSGMTLARAFHARAILAHEACDQWPRPGFGEGAGIGGAPFGVEAAD
jgi:hypothetical protein